MQPDATRSPDAPPRSRLPALVLVGAGAGILLGSGLHWAGVGRRPLPPLRRAPPMPSDLPPPPPAPPPVEEAPPWGLTLRSSLPPTREEVAWLELELERPAHLRATLERPGRPPALVFDAGERRRTATVALPPLPAGLQAQLRLEVPELGPPRTLEVRGRAGAVHRQRLEGPAPQGLGSGEDGAFLLQGSRELRFLPDAGGTPRSRTVDHDLHGAPVLRRGTLVVAGAGRDVRAFDATTLEPRWRSRLPGPARWPPLPVDPFQLAFLAETPEGLVLQCLEASRGVPMWAAPRRVEGRIPEGSYPIGGSRRLLLPLAPARVQALSLFGDEVLEDVSQVIAGRITAPLATSPREWRGALGADTGRVRTLDLLARQTLRERGHPAGNELLAGEIHAQPTLLPVRRLHFLDLHRLLVLTDREVLLLNASGGVNWRTGLPTPPAYGPALVPGRILVGLADGQVLHLSRLDGEVLEVEAGAELVPGSLAPGPGPLRWGRRDGALARLDGGGFPAVSGVAVGPLAPAPAADPAP